MAQIMVIFPGTAIEPVQKDSTGLMFTCQGCGHDIFRVDKFKGGPVQFKDYACPKCQHLNSADFYPLDVWKRMKSNDKTTSAKRQVRTNRERKGSNVYWDISTPERPPQNTVEVRLLQEPACEVIQGRAVRGTRVHLPEPDHAEADQVRGSGESSGDSVDRGVEAPEHENGHALDGASEG